LAAPAATKNAVARANEIPVVLIALKFIFVLLILNQPEIIIADIANVTHRFA
jgi:hypothetical protein